MPNRPPNEDTPENPNTVLKPCDILMCYGNAVPMSRIIREVDGGIYSHGALYYGERRKDKDVLEARYRGKKPGVYFLTLDELKEKCEYIDVYRHETELSKNACKAIQKNADDIADKRAEYDIVYSMLLLIPSIVDWLPLVTNDIRTLVDTLMDEVNRFIDCGNERLVCTEVLYRCYAVKDGAKDYTIEIVDSGRGVVERMKKFSDSMPAFVDYTHKLQKAKGRGAGLPDYKTLLPDEHTAIEHFLRAMAGPEETKAEYAVEYFRRYVSDGEKADALPVPASSVTPKDMQHSPSLKFVDRVYKANG